MPDTWPEDELPPPPSRSAVPRPATVPPPPAIDGYEVGELVGRGGMAVVYRARQRSLNRPVALKVLLVGPYADPSERARIRTEAEAIARLQHPNVVHVYEVGERDGLPYLLMEFVDGGTLADRIRAGPLPPARAAEWAEAIARGVHAAHRRGIVHRDLKPANVLMTSDDVPKISDFGIARRLDDPADRTRTGLVLGTPQYMAPEQAAGKKGVGPAADIWAVGAILYELLAGRPPFEGDSSLELMRKVETGTLTPPGRVRPGIPPALETICLKCLKKEPAARYPTAEALADDLARARGDLARPMADSRRSAGRWLVPLTVAAGAALLVLVAVKSMNKPDPGSGGAPVNGGGPPGPDTPITGVAGVPAGKAGPGPAADEVIEPRWEPFRIAADDDTFDQIAFPTRDIGYAASHKGVYRTGNGGEMWQLVWPRELPRGAHFLRFDDPDRGWLGTDRLLRTEDGGKTWNPVPLAEAQPMDVRALATDPGGWGLVGGNGLSGNVVLFRRRSGTPGWERVNVEEAGLLGKDQAYRNWILADLAVSGPRDGWALLTSATEDGVVLHTADGGDTWRIAFAPEPKIDLWHIHFVGTRQGWLAGSSGKLWTTDDGGATWDGPAQPGGEVRLSGFAFALSGESFAIAPLWKGQVLKTTDGKDWRVVELGLKELLDDSTPAAAVVDSGRAYVLGRGGHVARYTGHRLKP